MPFGGADLHFHSTCSDGVETPAELVTRAVAAGLSVAALTDHDAVHGIGAFEAAAEGAGLIPAGGTELSVTEGGEDVHLLGLFVDPEEPGLCVRLAEIRRVRDRRGEAMVEKLATLGVELDLPALRAGVGDGAFGRPHVARALVAKGVVRNTEEAFERFLGEGRSAFVPKARWGLGEAVEAVRRAGGLAVLAHPVWYADPAGLLRRGRDLGLDGVEVWHPDNDGREKEFLREAGALGLLVTGGSDFHCADGGRNLGDRRLGEAEWEKVAAAAATRRREAGRPPLDLSQR
jgi:3',5'-nucleoside bisphosphate phosphatase